MGQVKADFKGLSNALKAIGSIHKAQVGILNNGKKSGKREFAKNVEIGIIHEFGSLTKNIPARSFLRMPIETHFVKELKGNKKFDRAKVETAFLKGNTSQIAKDLGIAAERVILQAFDTEGWGQWEENAEATIKAKGSDKPLIDTGALRRSITSRVKK
ncbi:MAG: hypothetical protein LBT79_07455 [Elusimicrobiota bacterium]|jgi:phage gpG-like protein|nr:hypothetical protein [Elusimicrobiota bacterium]